MSNDAEAETLTEDARRHIGIIDQHAYALAQLIPDETEREALAVYLAHQLAVGVTEWTRTVAEARPPLSEPG